MIEVDVILQRGAFRLAAELKSDAHVTGIFGPSGSGKTSFLLAMAGLLRPVSGRLAVDGEVFFDGARRIHLPPHRRGIGFVFQEDRLFPHLDTRGNLLCGYRLLPPASRRIQPGEVIELLELENLLDQPVTQLSGGEARRVAMGRALLSSPRLLVLDEPLTGLDERRRRSILGYLMRIHERLSVRTLYVSHTLSDFLAVVDHAARIVDGRLVSAGSAQAVLEGSVDGDDAGPVESLIDGRVLESAGEAGYLRVSAGDSVLMVPSAPVAAGRRVRVAIPAAEVVLVVGALPQSSARNVISGRVTEIRDYAGRVLVTVDAGFRFLAEVTPAAAKDLQLEPGAAVHALIKARGVKVVAAG